MSKFNGEAGAGLLFMILYLFVFIWLFYAYITHRMKWRSRWSVLFFHVAIRLASQGCAIGFAILGFANKNIFIAFLILGAEGYFTLVLCTFRFVISWHQHNLPNGVSWLEPRRGAKIDSRARIRRLLAFLFLGPFALLIYHDNIMAAFHVLLALANSTIIVGGCYLLNADLSQFDSDDTQRKIRVARVTRTTGQGVFLACNAALLAIILVTIRNNRRTAPRKNGWFGVHPTLVVLLVTWVPLIVRGTYGILHSPNTYGEHGFSSHYTLVEYLMGVTTEWLACVLLSCTYATSRHDPPKSEFKPQGEGETRELEPVHASS
ncbi:hypothetical protein R3P38DRAFT_3388262 [Favolaschia claudopus]|uniref:Uncharacterized protein n=1 Tax=Favolaschia claudopus TaxID=2862362 RepID=A0AAW0D5M9_9AGAR